MRSYTLNKIKRITNQYCYALLSFPEKVYYLLFNPSSIYDKKPHFIIGGLPKCGTVWLVKQLMLDQNFFYGESWEVGKSEVRYFSLRFQELLKKYLKVFEERKDKIKFEKPSDYSISPPWKIMFIKRLFPEIKIILIFRDPIERAFSHAKMDLLRKTGRSLEEVPFEKFAKHYHKSALKFDYRTILDKWEHFFPASKLLVIDYEQIKTKPKNVLKGVYEFIGQDFSTSLFPEEALYKKRNTTEKYQLPKKLLDELKSVQNNNLKVYYEDIKKCEQINFIN